MCQIIKSIQNNLFFFVCVCLYNWYFCCTILLLLLIMIFISVCLDSCKLANCMISKLLVPMTVHCEQNMKREDQQDATIRCILLLSSVSTFFGHHFTHLQENKGSVTAFANIYVFPLVTEQHTKYNNRAFVLLKMGIMLPETS